MNKKAICLLVFTVLQLWAAPTAHAVVKTNYGFKITGCDASTKQYTVYIKQLPTTNIDETCATFRQTGPTEITFVGLCVDEGSDWYYGTYGQTFDNAAVSNGAVEPIVGVGITNWSMRLPMGYSYIAIRTSTPGHVMPRDVFGWVLLFNSACTVGVADCAFAYDEGGITVGEPASVAVPLTGAEMPIRSDIMSHEIYSKVSPGYKGMILRMTYTSSAPAGVSVPMTLQTQSSTNPATWIDLAYLSAAAGTVEMNLHRKNAANTGYEPDPADWKRFRIIRTFPCFP